MKLSCTSGAFDRLFDRGDLTQLEFLDRAARESACDGVVLNERHFPRRDDDYLAQIKKMAFDLGLDLIAVEADAFFSSESDAMERTIGLASSIGAASIVGRLASETAMSWTDQAQRLGDAAGLAKRANVTLAVRNAPTTFAATPADCKRAGKETDSAWLRFCLHDRAFGDESPGWADGKRVLSWAEIGEPAESTAAQRRGYLVLGAADGGATFAEMNEAMHRWRIARAESELNRT